MNIIGILILVLGIAGLSYIYLVRKRARNTQKLDIQKFNFCLLRALFLDNLENTEIYNVANRIEQPILARIIFNEIEKSKDNKPLLEKLYKIFDDLGLVDFKLKEYRRANIPKKIRIIYELSLVKTEKVKKLLLSILKRNESYQIVLEAGKILVGFLDGDIFYDFVLSTLKMPSEFNEHIINITCEYASKLIDAEFNNKEIDKNLRNEIYNKYLGFLFDEKKNFVIAAAYTLGYFKICEANEFLLDRMNSFSDRNVLIQLLKAIRKMGCVDSVQKIYTFILDKSDTVLIQEALLTLKAFGEAGEKCVVSLSNSQNVLLSVLAKAYLGSLENAK
jgi:hypothetical protein